MINVDKEIKKIMSDLFEIQEDTITNDTSIHNVENWDSLNHIQLVALIEEKFKMTLTADEITKMINFAEIIKILQDKGIKE